MEARIIEYAQRRSPIHAMDARWKLAGIVLSVAAVVALQTLPAAGGAFAASLGLLIVSRLPLGWFLARLGGVALFLTLFLVLLPFTLPGEGWEIGGVALSAHGLAVAMLIGLKALTVVALALVLFSTALFEDTLKAAHALHIPSLIVQLLMLTYRYLFLFGEELGKLRIALRLRGFRNRASLHAYRTVGRVTGTLLVRSYERAERVGHAMRCRSFDGRFRTLHTFRTRPPDVVKFAALVLLLGGLPLVIDWHDAILAG